MNKIKLLFAVSLAANVVLVSLFCYKLYHNWFEIGALKAPFRASVFDAAPADSSKIYFVGDSHTEAFELNELLQNGNVRNRGIWGDNSKGVLGRIKGVAERHPQKLFLMIGVNDVCAGASIQEVAANVEQTVKIIKSISPNTQVFIESVLPANWKILHTDDMPSNRIKELNELYKIICQQNKLVYINLFPDFFDGKGLKQEYSFDGLHLTGTGYVHLASLLKPYVNR
ncbi:MAG: G-D-S-L family lipolytic protein [Hymenobacter sp.]|nr:MAG: G-D-S-L family lipolytic protein [Hymenobacter sp.]